MSYILAALLLAAAPQTDASFIQAALHANSQEIAQASLEVDSSDPRVRDYAGRVSTDHQIANQQLIPLANSKGVDTTNVPSQPRPETTGNIHGKPYAPASGNPMNPVAYFKKEIALHRQAIALYEKEVSSGRDPQVRAYAQKQLPVLKKHLQLAENDLRHEQQQRAH